MVTTGAAIVFFLPVEPLESKNQSHAVLRGKGTGDVRFPCGVRRRLDGVVRFVKGGGVFGGTERFGGLLLFTQNKAGSSAEALAKAEAKGDRRSKVTLKSHLKRCGVMPLPSA